MKFILIILLFFFLSFISAQNNCVIINNNTDIVLSNTIYFVINQNNPLGIVYNGTGGIMVDNEQSRIIWITGINTGTYIIPYKTSENEIIKTNIQKTTGGVVSTIGRLIVSTYHTPNNNTPYPTNSDIWFSDVTNMWDYLGLDNSTNVLDRFWLINLDGYSINPNLTLLLTYDALGGITDMNGLAEVNLQAQYWNGVIWMPPIGIVDIINDNVNTITNVNYSAPWVIVNKNFPLPVELISFKAICKEDNIFIEWITASQINNDYFILEQSEDGINFISIYTINNIGTTNMETVYSTIVKKTVSTVFFRLKQVDYNGEYTYSDIITTSCYSQDKYVLSPNPAKEQESIKILYSNIQSIRIYNMLGTEVKILIKDNTINGLNAGLYFVIINEKYNIKLIVI